MVSIAEPRRLNTAYERRRTSFMPASRPPPPPPPPPSCLLGNETYPIGHQWRPLLPDFGLQECLACECTLKFSVDCYEPIVICPPMDTVPGACPEMPPICGDGSKPTKQQRGDCCPSCPGAATAPRPTQRWRKSNRQTQAAAKHRELNYELVQQRPEAFWLFKVIARDPNDRVFISAVKSVPLCR